MQLQKLSLGAYIIIMLVSCNQPNKQSNQIQLVNKPEGQVASSIAAMENPKDSMQKFVRTASLKFSVNDVLSATYGIEDITNKHQGYVSYTNLNSEIINYNSQPISEDSIEATQYYVVKNQITLQVPNQKLDTTLKEIAQYINFLDNRIITADDVSINIIANDLTHKRWSNNENNYASKSIKKPATLQEISEGIESISNGQEKADNAFISNLKLKNSIAYSTIQLNIYEHEKQHTAHYASYKPSKAYDISFWQKLWNAFLFGFELIGILITGIINIWPILAILLVCYFVFKKYTKK